MSGDFKAPYAFKVNGKEVIIQHKGGGDFGKFLRVKPGDLGEADPDGGHGKFARWEVEFIDGNSNEIKLKSKESGKYLRIKPDASPQAEDKIDVGGGGGKWTEFKVEKVGDQVNCVKLQSKQQDKSMFFIRLFASINNY